MSVTTQLIRTLQRNLKRALKFGQLGEAEQLFGQLRDEDPVSLVTRGLELELLIAKQRWPEAQSLAKQLQTQHPESARIQFLSGRLSYRQKHYQDALRYFEESQGLYAHWLTQRWIGKTLTQLGSFERAEATLLALLQDRDIIKLDLAWLYERMNQPVRALAHVEAFLKIRPQDEFAKTQKLRLEAQTIEPETLVGDIELLLDLDEEIPAAMLPAYINHLLEAGKTDWVRTFLANHRSRLEPSMIASLAWVCYKLQAFDLALDLFTIGLADRVRDVKYLSALESTARRCNRVAGLIQLYEQHAEEERRLYGRIKRLTKELEN